MPYYQNPERIPTIAEALRYFYSLLDDLGKVRDRRSWQKCLEVHCAE